MKDRFRITRRGSRGGAFYCVDSQTGKRTSLHTDDAREARRIVDAKNEAEQQPALNLQLAKAYLAGTDREINRRTWQEALVTLTNTKQGSNRERWERAAKDKAFAQPPQIRFGKEVEAILATLPKTGPLFPYLRGRLPGYRATEFKQRCVGLGIHGVTLHSYRYAWAERAKVAGYPERFAQLALGHNSKAVHRAYAKRAQVTLPPLEEYERNMTSAAVIPLPLPTAS